MAFRESTSENGEDLEALRHPEKLCIVTTTLYPLFESTNETDAAKVQTVRGKLAIDTFSRALEKGYQLEVCDQGSSRQFLTALESIGVHVVSSESEGRAPRKRLLYRLAQNTPSVEAIVWIEPEKVDMLSDDCIARCVEPILKGEADVVMPTRTQASLNTYPPYMVNAETISNEKCNALLRKHKLVDEDAPGIDHFFGPRMFANKPGIVDIFCEEYALKGEKETAFFGLMDPDIYSNSSYLPVVRALQEGQSVQQVSIDFHYSEAQRNIEMMMSPTFEKYRQKQRINIVAGIMELLRLSQDRESRLKRLQ